MPEEKQYEIKNRSIKLADYVPHPKNYNRHGDEQISRLSMSLERFGQPESVTVWENPHEDEYGEKRKGYFVAGHGVREAALQLGWAKLRADVLPVDYPEELALAYLPASNRLAQLSDPDEAALARLLDELGADDEDLMLSIGYDGDEIGELLSGLEGMGGVGLGEGEGSEGADTDTEPEVEFKEFDESIADDVEMVECIHCGKETPK